jgi:opacity protein-like surface antigen
MMKKSITILGTLVVMGSHVIAGGDIDVPTVENEAQVTTDGSSFYAGIAMSAVSARDASKSMDFFDESTGQDRLANVTFLAGYNYNPYLALEGRYTTTFTDEDILEMDGWSLFVKPQYPLTESFNVYALLGFGNVSLDPVSGSRIDLDDTGFQWGVGASYDFTDTVSVFFDYTNLANEMDGLYWNGALQIDTDTLNLGVTYKF